jgi:hypothetical protein
MLRTTVRRAAVLAATGTIAALAAAGPALAADTSAVHGAQTAAAAENVPAASAFTMTYPDWRWCHHHHHGLVGGLLEGVGDVLYALL